MARARAREEDGDGVVPALVLAPTGAGPAPVAAVPCAEEAAAMRRTGTVRLVLPADPAYLSVLRMTSAGLAARLDLPLDEVEDLRIAVDEAASLVIADKRPGDELEATFELAPGLLVVQVRGPARHLPERGSVAWAVLEALAGEVRSACDGSGSVVTLRHESRQP